MDLFERLPQDEIHKLWRYIEDFGGGTSLPESRMSYFLRYWNNAKKPFFEAFGEKFIIKKAVCFDKPHDDLEDEMEENLRYNSNGADTFRIMFKEAVERVFPYYTEEGHQLRRFIGDWKMLVDNYYDGPAITIPASATKNGHPLQINHNCKVSKMLGKIAEALGCETFYEAFRQAHSQVLNQKTIRGNLCLSIHPLDFLTMSDNASGWGSCMSWMDEPGDYRLGTIEMMNSNYVVIAYVEAKEPMYMAYPHSPEVAWNNKRWRQLFMVTPEMILGNRQYPYQSDYLQGTAIKWLRELMTPIVPFGPYELETCMVENHKTNVFGSHRSYIDLEMDYMYNDIYGHRLAYISMKYFSLDQDYRINYSGPAVCVGCGDVIEPSTVEAHEVQCRYCSGYFYCNHCGEWSSGDCHVGADGKNYCDWCYYNELEMCECCEDRADEYNLHHVYIQFSKDKNFDKWRYYVSLCESCYRSGCYEKMYGPIFIIRDEYGHERLAFDLANIDDDALLFGELDRTTAQRLIDIRNAATAAERASLIERL